ncbi:MAG TPA: hypothetical protein ENK57_04475 [Polyangiaceae bacterium]|nr:hypothetical protein [Polyangiaceae bacterium]
MFRHSAPSALALGAVVATLTGCGADELTEGAFVDPTEIAVDPSDFLGEVSCSPNPGAARAYVMTLVLWQDASDTEPFVVGSSRPGSCAVVTGFRNVIEGSRYTALVDVYDIPSTSLFPFGGPSSGSRQMRDASGANVTPRWQTQCGGGASTAAVAVQNARVFARPCDPLSLDADATTRLTFSPTLVLGSDTPCDVAPAVDVFFDDPGLPATTSLACDAEPVTYDVAAGTYEIYARVDDGQDVLGTTCLASVAAGTTATPICGPLTSLGNARLDLGSLEDGQGDPLCPTGQQFDVFDGEVALNPVPLPCGKPALLGPFDAGDRTFEAIVYDTMGALQPMGASCDVTVEPGRTAEAVCTLAATP